MSGDKEPQRTRVAETGHARRWLQIAAVAALAAPAPVLRLLEIFGGPHPQLSSQAESALFGLCIFAAAILLVWAAEVAEQLISATLALAVLAIIAVLPEYAVDLYFAWTAPDNPENAQFALANMTGANRLLVGLAWPAIFLLFWLRHRKRSLAVGDQNAVGLIFLGIATLYSFTIPLRQHISLIDSAILISLFVTYLVLSSRSPPREGELFGPPRAIAALPLKLRWGVIIGLFTFAAGTVIAAAEPFAEGLVDSGRSLGIEEFLLVQWIAPLASEAPEFILAAMLALRGRAAAGMTILISSKVNQWTLLVGSLPIAFSISGTSLSPMEIDGRQVAEVFLTAGQSLFAVAILMSLSIDRWEAALIFVLFSAQFVFPSQEVRYGFGITYIVLAFGWLLAERRFVPILFQTARRELTQTSVANPGKEPGGT
ncbi:MAG: sodium:calcium antiporter [Chloroflexi bacterium]|nr:sodium:calcium antiporter [Chloroflexota bacterium]